MKARRCHPALAASAALARQLIRVLLIAFFAGASFRAFTQGFQTPPSSSHGLPVSTLTNLVFEQKPGAQLSLNLRFRDEDGQDVALSHYFNGKPVIAALGYYECPMLCNLVLNGLVESLHHLQLSSGRDFEVLFASIDSRETPALASAKKLTYLQRYGRSSTGWHFLTGRDEAVSTLAREVGFHYAYDPLIRQYAHPSGIVVLTPDGKISKYFLGVSYPPAQLSAALKGAAAGQAGAPAPPLLVLCFRFMPLTGKYSGLLMTSVRLLALLTLLGVAGLILAAARYKSGRAVAQRNKEKPLAGA